MVGNYPAQRSRAASRSFGTTERFGRYESPTTEFTCADTDATVIDFSGTPDAIYVEARLFSALVKLSDRLGRETSYFAIPVGQGIWLPIARDRVIAKNLVAGSNAAIWVTGAYASPDERGEPAY